MIGKEKAATVEYSRGLTADQLCTTPLIEDLVPTNEEWEACEAVKDRYDLMKRRVRLAFSRAAITETQNNG